MNVNEQEQRLADRKKLREQLGKKAAAEKLDDGLDFAERAPGSDESEKAEEEPDILLVEAAHVLGDLVSLNDPKLRTALLGERRQGRDWYHAVIPCRLDCRYRTKHLDLQSQSQPLYLRLSAAEAQQQ